jgi:hypothetical protein
MANGMAIIGTTQSADLSEYLGGKIGSSASAPPEIRKMLGKIKRFLDPGQTPRSFVRIKIRWI